MLKLNCLTLTVQMCTDPSYGIIANMMLICFFTAWRKSIRRLWKIPNTTHCNLLSSINISVPIVINLERSSLCTFLYNYMLAFYISMCFIYMFYGANNDYYYLYISLLFLYFANLKGAISTICLPITED